jgi:hypothetical protein
MINPKLKCQKYLTKLSTITINNDNFGLYLNKLNYWYAQIGSGDNTYCNYKNNKCITRDKYTTTGKCIKKSGICTYYPNKCIDRDETNCMESKVGFLNKCRIKKGTRTCEDKTQN